MSISGAVEFINVEQSIDAWTEHEGEALRIVVARGEMVDDGGESINTDGEEE